MIIMPPIELLDYISFDDGKWNYSEDMPDELQPLFNDFVQEYKRSKEKSIFID